MDSPPTREDKRLNLLIATIPDTDSYELTPCPPLSTEDGKLSDHKTLLLKADIKRSDRFKITYKWTRPMTKKGREAFDNWIKREDWATVLEKPDANTQAAAMVNHIDRAMDSCFP